MLISSDLTYIEGALLPGFALETDGETVTALRPLRPGETGNRHVRLLAPGLTDLQVNGGGGVLVNSSPTPEGLRAIRAAHLGLGTAALLPTVITDAPEVLEAAADAVIATKGEPGLLGLHIEGPHIAPARKGTHDAAHIRPLDQRSMAVLKHLRAAEIPVLLTLAPEVNDPALMREAAALGVVLSAGHSMATAEEARTGIKNGVTMFTHLFNAMPQMQSRAPGMIAAAILSDCFVGLIADGIHVDWDALRVALAARPRADRSFLVSDAMPTVGGPDHFNLYGQDIHVDAKGRLVNAEGNLAGAHVSLLDCVLRLHRNTGLPLAYALAMATDIPRRAMRLPPLRLAEGLPLSDVLALNGTDFAKVAL
ncbi:N-acetylglucosamine-6-phosphate deacetylase [Paracoccus aminophilus]|uniref:N-acetylglucosamine-6-phosphate deacetylase n=1 Tax=Paracoccus aminophilus JCM 7686 TaxID=1367847 RepID=S5Y453_PARAH|nr:amidohydrolase family protein [Paracoccus aminophilus]AGT10505.1 N-acetylglucosamine-6-phosphate deacetylase [Paracoccus aminophilus JCM 7686]